MSPKKLPSRRGDRAEAVGRQRVGKKYLEVAELVATEEGPTVNVCVGLCVLAGIAAGDAVCLTATGERYSGTDHSAAATFLERVDSAMGKHLRNLVALKPKSHYGDGLLSAKDRSAALRSAHALIDDATRRLS